MIQLYNLNILKSLENDPMTTLLRKIACAGTYTLCMLAFFASNAEGTKQLSPIIPSGDTSIVMLRTNGDSTGNFMEYNGAVVSRLNIRITDVTDTVYIGLSREYDDFGDPDGFGGVGTYCFRIKDPSGTVVHGPFSMNSGNVNADSWELAMRGPDVLDPLGYSTSPGYARFIPSTTGDFYIEMTDNTSDCTMPPMTNNPVNIKFFDITVVNGGVEIPGRLWSLNWALISPPIDFDNPPECQFDRPFDGVLFSYTMDGFVSRIDFDSSGFQGLQFNVAFGLMGPGMTGDVIEDRKSVYNMDATSGAADHMVFINEPDPIEFPSSTDVCGEVELLSVSCVQDSFCFNIGVTEAGQVEIILDFDGDGEFTDDTVDVILAMLFEMADTACIGWNGLKGDGSMLTLGEDIPAIIRYSQGVQHYAAYDVELLKYGFCVETIRPICPGFQTNFLYWDDSNLQDDPNTLSYDESDPGTGQPLIQLNGCECQVNGCRTWTNVHVDADTSCTGQITGYGDRSTLNTWWFATTMILGPLDIPFVSVNIQGDSAICLGDSTQFTAFGFPDTINYLYAWEGPNGFMATTQSTGFVSDPGVYSVTITDTVSMCSASDTVLLQVFDPPMLSLTFMCNGPNEQEADVDLTVTGAGPFTFLWSNGAMTEDLFDVGPDTYIVTVTDTNGCVAIDSIVVEGCCALDFVCPSMDGGQYACSSDVPAPDTTLIVVNDYCDPLTISSMDASNGGSGCPGDELIITRTYTITDGAGSSGTCVQIITVVDDVPPSITCPADITVNCDEGVDPMVTGSPIVSDNCSAEGDLIVMFSDSGAPGICSTDPPVIRTWTVTDECGNSASCQQTITVQDIEPPVIDMGTCPADVTIECGVPVMFAAPPTYTDNCTPTGLIVLTFRDDSTGFDGSCVNQVVGTVTRTFFAEDLCGNIDSSCVSTATVEDTTPPTLLTCPADTTVQCSAPADTLGFPTYLDLCSNVTVTFQDDTVGFMPPNLGMIIRTFYGTDACGNVDSSCVQTITIQDSVAPSCITMDITINLDAVGNASIANDAVDDGSSDDCGVESITLSQTSFSCLDVGDVVVVQTVTDFNGNSSTCTATVTVLDVTAPECLTQDITVQLDASGAAMIADNAVDNGSNDTCGIASITVSPNSFSCADVGVVVVTQTVTDVNGNTSSCTANVTVEDNVAPECLAQDITVSLDPDGTLILGDDAIDNGSNDACGIASITISPNTFDCNDVGSVVVFQTVTDVNGNTSGCSANVTIEDNTAPECITQDITVYLDGAGNATITGGDVDGGSNDACGIASVDVSPSSFTCADLGDNVVTQTVTDENGNTSSCTAIVTVADTTAPMCIAMDITVQLDVDGNATITDDALDGGSSDNCNVASVTLSQTAFGCADVGGVVVTQTVTDGSGNSSTCTATVTVEDNIAPECLTQDITVQLDANGVVSITDDAVDNGSNDACGIDAITLSQLDFTCDDLGDNVVTQSVTDVNGNSAQCTAIVTVEDNVAPVIVCPANTTVSCAANVPPVNTGSVTGSDNCGGSITITHVGDVISNQTCANRFTVTRTYRATDASGNTADCAQIITVNDVTPPTIECPADATIMMPIEYSPDITGTPTTSDNCAGAVATVFNDVIIPGECEDQFVVERTWTATDVCGNSATCLQIITVDNPCGCDLICPPDITVTLDPGACDIIINYPDPMFEGGGCPPDITEPATLTQNTNTTLIQDALQCGVNPTSHWRAYDLAAMGVSGDFQMNSLGMASWSAGTVQVFVYSYTGTLPSGTLDLAQMTLVGQSNPMAVGGFSLTTHTLNSPALIPAGTKFVVEQRQLAGGPWCIAGNYAGNSQPAYMNCIGSPFGFPAVPTSYPNLGYGQIHPIQVLNGSTFVQGAILVQISGLPSGSAFPIGTTTNCFQLIDAATDEVVDSCCFDVVVNEYPIQLPPACNDLVQISLDENCEARICADVILEGGPYGCYDDFDVFVDQYPDTNVNCVSLPFTPGLHTVTIVDPETGISCWGTFLIEDKLPPTITCQDFTLTCGQDLTPVFTPPIMGVNTCSQFPGLPIGPNAGVITTSTCQVSLPQGVEIVDVNVCVKITHTWIGDCNTDIISPSGEVTNLWGFGQCGPTDNMFQKFDDDGPLTVLCVDINSGCDFILQPVAQQLGTPSLDQYIGGNPNGTWTLMITDNANGDGGTLDEWHLEIEYAQNAPFAPTVSDNCDTNLDLVYSDETFGEICDSITILRTWTVTDDAGLTAQCVQTLTIEPLTLATLECPANYVGTCGTSSHPDVTGWPTVDGTPIVDGGVCNIFVGYWDQELADCGNGKKIVRRWSILDWCTQEIEECLQIIKLTDDQAPVLTCPANQTIGTDPWFCNRDVILQLPQAVDLCGTPFTISPSVSAGTLIHFGGNNYRADDLPLGTHIVTWTATDACGNSSTCTYTITVVDDKPPIPICDEHTILTLTLDDDLNEGLTKIYATSLDDGSYDNCGPVTFLARRMDSCIDFDWIGPNGEYPNNDGGLPESIDRGLTFQPWVPFACCDVGNTIMVELRVTDLAGNINSCMVEVEVQDKLPPFIVCPPDITVSCEFWFDGQVTNGFQPSDGLEDVFGRVLDEYDYDESDREDIIINDPGNTQLSQPHNWGIDGWADDNCDVTIDVRTRIFDDCSGDDLPSGAPNWAVRLVERTFRAQDGQGNTSTCRQRIWVVDFDPFTITDTQCGLNNADDVRWPCDLTLTDCPGGPLTPENLSAYAPNNRPIVNDDNCSVIGMTYDDKIFYFVDGACYKIVRTWTVIDWCQFDPVQQTGYWQYVQVIKVNDHVGPEFVDCPDGPVTLCVNDPGVTLPDNNQVFLGEGDPNSSACSAHVLRTHTVNEMCSDEVIYDVKVYLYNSTQFVQVVSPTHVSVDSNNQAILTLNTKQNSLPSNHPIRRYGLPYNDKVCSNWPLPGGTKDYHRVLWTVEDGCGNVRTCSYLLRIEDCKKPTPICVGLSSVVMPSSGCVTIWAKDFDAGSSVDDCTAHDDLLFSFSGQTYQPSRTFCCEDLEENGSPSFLVEIWVGDEGNDQNCNGFVQPLGIEWSERNKDYCTTFIVIDDNEEVCPGGVGVGGSIQTEDIQNVAEVMVQLTDQSGNVVSSYVTNQSGSYHFSNPLVDFIVKPSRNDNHKNGVSTLDLVDIQKHLLGIKLLDSPYKLIAADANNSKSVSVVDLVEIRKLILGHYVEFPNNQSWRFVDAKFDFNDPTHPWPFNETIRLQSGMTDDEDFMAVKVGDVNSTVRANATQIQTRGARQVMNLMIEDRDVVAGETVTIDVLGANFTEVIGYQFTLATRDLEYTGVQAGALDMRADYVAAHEGAITTSWGSAHPVTVNRDEALFTLSFKALKDGRLSVMLEVNSQITEAEAYTEQGDVVEILDVALNFGSVATERPLEYALYQNEPNPFAHQTVIGFDLPEALHATLTIFDIHGRVVHRVDGDFVQGFNQVTVKAKELSIAGAYYYRLNAGDFTATKKLILWD